MYVLPRGAEHLGRPAVDETAQLDLDLSALELDDFEVAEE
jgi:hypothetical protein